MIELKPIYEEALRACAPGALIARVKDGSYPRAVVAIGKCAGALLDGFGEHDAAFVAIPRGYPRPRSAPERIVFEGGHPHMTHDSFVAGKALLDFTHAHDEITFLISGGGSACVEWAVEPFSERELIDVNARLIRSGIPIGEINCVRKHLSAIKGGRLAARLRRSVTLVYSDVSTGALADVASGPSVPDPTTREQAHAILRRIGVTIDVNDETPKTIATSEMHLIADNGTLRSAAANVVRERGGTPVMWDAQIESNVADAAAALANAAKKLQRDEVLIAGGEPTVIERGEGKGGRCSELAVRFAVHAHSMRVRALFGSSDGVDGNSGAAAVLVDLPVAFDREFAERELARSNSMAVVGAIGSTIPSHATGNNLRDLYLLACS